MSDSIISRRSFLQSAAAGAAAAALPASAWGAPGRPPNVLLIISDDQGWTDYGFMGHPHIKTPHLDRLARQSVVFKRGYVAAPVCGPSLASIITGLHPQQHLFYDNYPPGLGRRGQHKPEAKEYYHGLARHPRLPALLAEKGCVSLQTGKWWHQDFSVGGFTHGTMTYAVGSGRHKATQEIGRKTMDPIPEFIENARKAKKPFLLWYAPMMPHAPHNPPEKYKRTYQKFGEAAPYYGMCEWFDETCGQVLEMLDKNGVADNTLVAYVCDNGWKQKGDTTPHHSGKRSCYEGGIRTPIMLRWPGRIKPQVLDTPVMSVDLAPTILTACGLEPPPQMTGVDLAALAGGEVPDREAIFGCRYGEAKADVSVRWCIEGGRWKLLLPSARRGGRRREHRKGWDGSGDKGLQPSDPELYDIRKDPHEQNPIDDRATIARLTKRIESWWAATEAEDAVK